MCASRHKQKDLGMGYRTRAASEPSQTALAVARKKWACLPGQIAMHRREFAEAQSSWGEISACHSRNTNKFGCRKGDSKIKFSSSFSFPSTHTKGTMHRADWSGGGDLSHGGKGKQWVSYMPNPFLQATAKETHFCPTAPRVLWQDLRS